MVEVLKTKHPMLSIAPVGISSCKSRLYLSPVVIMVLRTKSASNSNIRLNTNSDIGLSWYLSVLSCKKTIEEFIRDEYDHIEAYIAT
ncbi:hypothetical protein LT330_001769 [Penicillium expansum]|nr:hypothetical protein LT330_001769 [Penicillium expansum]